jgi:hemophore-related protein
MNPHTQQTRYRATYFPKLTNQIMETTMIATAALKPVPIAGRCSAIVAAAAVAAAAVFYTIPGQAAAAPGADCTAATLAHTISGVAAGIGDYLDAHPDVNTAFTNLKGEPRPQMRADAQRYLDANPSVRADLQGLRAPVNDLAQRCGLTVPAGPLGI